MFYKKKSLIIICRMSKKLFFTGVFCYVICHFSHVSYVASVKFHIYINLFKSQLKLVQLSQVASVKCESNCKIYKKNTK